VRGVDGEVEISDVVALRRAVDNQNVDEGWSVALRRISQAARDEAAEKRNRDLFCYTFDELLDENADFSGYLDWLESEIVRQGIDKMYIPLACKKEEYDPETNQYLFQNKIGDLNYRNPTYMSFDEYQEFELKNSVKSYWKERSMSSAGLDRGDGIIPKIYIGGKFFETIFGNNTIDIRPQGSAELIFGIMNNKTDNPTLNVRQRRTTNFDFDMKIQMNVVAKIGDKIEFRTNYNTEATFDFENKLQLKYEGKEDEIMEG